MHRKIWGILLTAAMIFTTACQSKPASAPDTPATATAQPADSTVVQNNVLLADPPQTVEYEQVNLASLPETAVTIFTQGTGDFTLKDILPLSSDSSGYSQKWEFFIYTKPYEVRLKFEISNFAFSKNEGKVKGYVLRYEGDKEAEEIEISESFDSSSWKAAKDRLDLKFGDYSLSWSDGLFHLKGAYKHGTFEYDIPANPWKPGTGNTYFGNDEKNVFKYSILTYQQPVAKGHFVVDGKDVDVKGEAYANHYATTVAVYDMFDEVSDFRMHTDDLHVEFRYYVPSAKYDPKPFGFMFAAYKGQQIIGSTDMTRTTLDKWLDDQNYGYEIDARQSIEVRDGNNKAVFEMLSAEPRPSDPYADLGTFKRNVAMRFAKPIEYSILIDWVLHLDVDGYQAKIPYSNTYTITRLR